MDVQVDEVKLREAVYWGFRLILGREPEPNFSVQKYLETMQDRSFLGIRNRLMGSPEFTARFGDPPTRNSRKLKELIARHRELKAQESEAGFFKDCFGIRTRVAFLPSGYGRFSGHVAGDFEKQLMPIHDDTELIGMLDGVADASGRLCVVELGAGWGPWVTLGAQIARKMGIPFHLVAVEASAKVFQSLLTHLSDNGINPDEHRILRGAIGPSDLPGSGVVNDEDFDSIKKYSIASILPTTSVVDVLHCDIQGAEAIAFEPAMGFVTKQIRRVIIGTHGRAIEERLFEMFSDYEWSLVDELPCIFKYKGGRLALHQDGTQVWVNKSSNLVGF